MSDPHRCEPEKHHKGEEADKNKQDGEGDAPGTNAFPISEGDHRGLSVDLRRYGAWGRGGVKVL